MRGISLSLRRALCSVLSALLVLSPSLSLVPSAFAATTGSQAPPGPVEVVSRRTAYATHWQLPDGTYRCDLSSSRVRFKSSSGSWQNIDTSLVPSTTAGVSTERSNDAAVEFGNASSGRKPVHIAKNGWSLDMEPMFGAVGNQVDVGDQAQFLSVASNTDLDYESGPDSIKETIVLRSASAPTTFAFKLSLSGLEIRGSGSSWALYRSGSLTPEMSLGALDVEDSAANPVSATGATMSVSPTSGGAIITYSIPASWLSAKSRVFPVKIDPSLWWGPNVDTYTDSYNTTSTAGGTSSVLKEGRLSSLTEYHALVCFDMGQANLPANAYPDSATLKLYSDANATTQTAMGVATVNSGWSEGSTSWSNEPAHTQLTTMDVPSHTGVTAVMASCAAMTKAVQDWYWYWQWNHDQPDNHGFVLYRTTTPYSVQSFHSRESANYQPTLGIGYCIPTTTLTTDKTVVHADGSETVSATVAVATGSGSAFNDISDVELDYGGVRQACWSLPSAVQSGFYYRPGPNGGYWGDTDVTKGEITTAFDRSSVSIVGSTAYYTFNFKVNDALAAASLPLSAVITIGDGEAWTDGAPNVTNANPTGPTLSVLPGPATMSYDATQSSESGDGWWTQPDANGDGIADAGNDTASSGRGNVNLAWKPVQTATGYKIFLHDGNTWQQVGSTSGVNSTTWSTAGKAFFPKDSAIASLTAGYTGNPFTAPGAGVDLRDDPSVLYTKMGSGSRALETHYRFKVVPYNSAGDAYASSSASQTEFLATLPNRTIYANADERHPDYDLPDMAKHDAGVHLDNGELTLSTTDLSIASWGPDAELSRSYNSLDPGTGTYTSGWRFNFEQSVVATSGFATYTDADGAQHRFVKSGSTYIAPRGFAGSLATSGTGYALTLIPDHGTLKFDGTGKLLCELDSNGNATNYVWTGGGSHLSIIAANGQSIEATFAAGQIVSATYAPGGGVGREVDYSETSGTVTYFPGTSDVYTVSYGYTNGLLSEIYIPSAYYESGGNYAARWDFTYDGSNRLSAVRLPGYNEVSHNRAYGITYGSGTATVSDPTDDARGVTETYAWNADGVMSSRTTPHFGGDQVNTWQLYDDPMLTQARETSPLGHETRTITDLHGNQRAEVDADGGITTYAIDGNDRTSVKADPLGSTTTYTYAGNTTNVLTETHLLDSSGTTAGVAYTYNASGTVTQESKTMTNPASFVITAQYSNFAPSGDWQTQKTPGVQFYSDDSSHTVTESKAYDAYGNTVSETDASGTVTAATSYSIAGRALVATDAAGAATRHVYDTLGDEIETSKTAGSAFTDWKRSTVDPSGHTLLETFLGSGGTSDHTVTHTFDSAGNETASVHSIEGTTTNTYDAAANLTASTPPAVGATTHVFDADGRQTKQFDDGSATPTVNTLDAAGRDAQVTNPDGSSTRYTYDPAGNKLSETKTGENGTSTIDVYSYDLGGRLISETDNAGGTSSNGYWGGGWVVESVTANTYDLLGQQLTAGLAGQGAATNTYNTLGWTIAATDPDGVPTTTRFDATGRTLQSTEGTAPATITTYDSAGRATAVSNPDGSAVASRYDALGRTIEQTQTSSNGTLAKHTLSAYDAFGRATATTDTVAGVVSAFQYAAGASKASTATISYGGVSSTISYGATNLETNRTSSAGATNLTRTVKLRDAASRVTSWTVSGIGQNGTVAYNGAGKMTAQGGYGWASGGATYTYDPVSGRKTSESINTAYPSSAWTGTYTYMNDGRLAGATIGGSTGSYSYDAAGNLVTSTKSGTTTTLAYDGNNRLLNTSVGGSVTTTFTFDSRGRRTAQGPTTAPTQQTFTWDAADHLVHYHYGSPRSVEATFAYDGTGQRVSSVVTSGSVTTTTTYSYNGLSLLSLSATDSAGTTYTITYLHDESSRPYAAIYRGKDSVTPRVIHLVTTDHGDIVELLTDTGNAFASYRYDAWGTPTVAASSDASCSGGSLGASLAANLAARQPLRYADYAFDGFSGLYYLSARYYDPTTMQYTSKDPARADGEDSAYQYCAGNPTGRTDPSGLYMIDDGPDGRPHRVDVPRWGRWHAVSLTVLSTQVYGHGIGAAFLANFWKRIPTYTADGQVEVCVGVWVEYRIRYKRRDLNGRRSPQHMSGHRHGRALTYYETVQLPDDVFSGRLWSLDRRARHWARRRIHRIFGL